MDHRHLPFPFEGNCTIAIINTGKPKYVNCELAISVIEIFQSLHYREPSDFTAPLVLKFPNPLVPSFVLSNYNFDVEHICVDENDKVVKVFLQKPKINSASFVQAVVHKLVILAPPGFAVKNKISTKSKIIIKP